MPGGHLGHSERGEDLNSGEEAVPAESDLADVRRRHDIVAAVAERRDGQ